MTVGQIMVVCGICLVLVADFIGRGRERSATQKEENGSS